MSTKSAVQLTEKDSQPEESCMNAKSRDTHPTSVSSANQRKAKASISDNQAEGPTGYYRTLNLFQEEQQGLTSFEMIPKLLVERFGQPSEGDGCKVSGQYRFADGQGNSFYIYDWKLTTLCGGWLSPEEFWDLEEAVPLQLGGSADAKKKDIKKFFEWLDGALVDGLQSHRKWLAQLRSSQPLSHDEVDRIRDSIQKDGELRREDSTAVLAALSYTHWLLDSSICSSPPTPETVKCVGQLLQSPSNKIRREAACAVVKLGHAAADCEILTPLFRMLGEVDRMTRVTAELQFKKLGEITAIPGLLSHLCQSLSSQDFQVKASALRVARAITTLTGEKQDGRRLIALINGSKVPKKR